MTRILLFLTITVLTFSSCTVSKRLHRPGLHIEWKRNYKCDASITVNSDQENCFQNNSKTDLPIIGLDTGPDKALSLSNISVNSMTFSELNSKFETNDETTAYSDLSAESVTNTHTSHVFNNTENADKFSDSYPGNEKRSKSPFKTAIILACIGVLLIALSIIFIEALYFLYIFPAGAGLILLLIALIYLIIGLAS